MADQLKALLNELSDDIGEARGRCSGDYLGPLVRKIIELVDRAEQVGVPTVQAGDEWVLVPVYPNQEMINAFVAEYHRPGGSERACYTAMINAAPSQPVAGKVQGDDLVLVPRDLIGAACGALKRAECAPKTLEQLRRYTVGDLSTTANAGKDSEVKS